MRRLLGAVALACLAALPASAQGYFEGKTITYIIATDPGGGYDAYGRLIGKYLEGKLGAKRVIFKNLPGAGHIIGANTLYASEPDGLTIGTFNTGLIYAQILGRQGVQFDLTQFQWIGKASSDPRVLVLAKTSGLKTYEDLKNSAEPVRFASTGIGSASYTETKMLADGLDLKVDLIPGYQGNDAEMAMLRSEIAGQVGSLSSLQPFIDTGDATVALAIGGSVEPQAIAYAETDKAKSIVSLIDALSNLGRLSAAPPGVAPEVVEELRNAYMAVMEDPDFLAEAEKLGLPIDPARGDAVAEMVSAALQQTPETVEIIASANEVEIPTVTVESAILALEDRNKLVTFNGEGGETQGEISGSRTLVTLNGADAKRDDLAVGMNCRLTYDPAGSPIEFTAVECAGETVAAAESSVMMVTSAIVNLGNEGKEVTFLADGAEKMGEISGSRTALTIDGAEAKRDALAVGMNCEFSYEDGAEIEFKTVACSTAAASTAMMVTSAIVNLGNEGKEVTFLADGAEKMGEISGSRTALTIDGAEAKRDALAVGMNCEFSYEDGAEIEFKTVDCKSK